MSVLLIVAKAPVAGLAKTRLSPAASPRQAARIAAASLLDTLDAALAVPDTRTVVAFTGELAEAERAEEIAEMFRHTKLIRQRGEDFADRLANAHTDVARLGLGQVLQIGMDTPQVTPALLRGCLRELDTEQAVLGAATDGGWWALGLRDPDHAAALRGVPMSRPDTGSRTMLALAALRPAELPTLSDVDTMDDALAVAREFPATRFAAAVTSTAAALR